MGGGSILSMRVTGEQSNGLLRSSKAFVVSGGPPIHVHQAEGEVVVVLEGALTYRVGAEHHVREAGGLLWFPRLVPHAVANLSDEPCRFLMIVTPAGIEDFFRAQRDYLASLPPGAPPDPAAFGALPGAESRPGFAPALFLNLR